MAEQLTKPDWRSVAEKIVRVCVGVRPGEVVQLGGGVHNFSLLAALAAAVRRAGAFAELTVTSDDLQWETLTTTPLEHLRTVPPHRLRWLEDIDVMIVTDAVEDPSRAAAVPEERRLAAHAAAEAVERRIFERGLRWAYVGWPTAAATRGLAVTFERFWSMFWRAVDTDYERLATEAAVLREILEEADHVRIVSERGTDLTLRLARRPVLVDDGVISAEDLEHGDSAVTLPAGQVFVAPQEDSCAGRLAADLAVVGGRIVHGLELDVEGGCVRAAGGLSDVAEQLEQALADQRGDKDRVGALGIGLNPGVDRLVGYALTDAKRRGAVRLGVGDNRLLAGANAATIQWDLYIEQPTVLVDGRAIIEAGRLRLGR